MFNEGRKWGWELNCRPAGAVRCVCVCSRVVHRRIIDQCGVNYRRANKSVTKECCCCPTLTNCSPVLTLGLQSSVMMMMMMIITTIMRWLPRDCETTTTTLDSSSSSYCIKMQLKVPVDRFLILKLVCVCVLCKLVYHTDEKKQKLTSNGAHRIASISVTTFVRNAHLRFSPLWRWPLVSQPVSRHFFDSQ